MQVFFRGPCVRVEPVHELAVFLFDLVRRRSRGDSQDAAGFLACHGALPSFFVRRSGGPLYCFSIARFEADVNRNVGNVRR